MFINLTVLCHKQGIRQLILQHPQYKSTVIVTKTHQFADLLKGQNNARVLAGESHVKPETQCPVSRPR